jgi:hypothetical protein
MTSIKELYLTCPVENYVLNIKNNIKKYDNKNVSYIKFINENNVIFLYNKKTECFFCNYDYFYHILYKKYGLNKFNIEMIAQEIINKYNMKIMTLMIIYNIAIKNVIKYEKNIYNFK